MQHDAQMYNLELLEKGNKSGAEASFLTELLGCLLPPPCICESCCVAVGGFIIIQSQRGVGNTPQSHSLDAYRLLLLQRRRSDASRVLFVCSVDVFVRAINVK